MRVMRGDWGGGVTSWVLGVHGGVVDSVEDFVELWVI